MQLARMIIIAVLVGLFAASAVWLCFDLARKLGEAWRERRIQRKLKADANALMEQAAERREAKSEK
jgi:uncharacterized membrane protein YdjX (TVP38/TMEM64 family)